MNQTRLTLAAVYKTPALFCGSLQLSEVDRIIIILSKTTECANILSLSCDFCVRFTFSSNVVQVAEQCNEERSAERRRRKRRRYNSIIVTA